MTPPAESAPPHPATLRQLLIAGQSPQAPRIPGPQGGAQTFLLPNELPGRRLKGASLEEAVAASVARARPPGVRDSEKKTGG